ncbi:MAG: ABC transporter permease [Gammaproteobacteria bacterium]|nr:ABC transporter permease [Gammaproteobacteria bacterium]
MIAVVFKHEVHALFRTPFAWWVLAAVQFLIAYQFLAQIDIFVQYLPKLRGLAQPPGVTQMVVIPLFGVTALVLLFLLPVLTMHSFSGERRAGILRLWYSAPIRLSSLVLGKFCGLMSLNAALWSLNALMPLTLLWGTALDLGTYTGGLLGLFLLMMAGTAIGLCFSALSAQPATAAIGTFVSLLVLWLIDWASQFEAKAGLLSQLSMFTHFQRLTRGLLDSFSVAYFLLITLGALALAVWALHGDRRAL